MAAACGFKWLLPLNSIRTFHIDLLLHIVCDFRVMSGKEEFSLCLRRKQAQSRFSIISLFLPNPGRIFRKKSAKVGVEPPTLSHVPIWSYMRLWQKSANYCQSFVSWNASLKDSIPWNTFVSWNFWRESLWFPGKYCW